MQITGGKEFVKPDSLTGKEISPNKLGEFLEKSKNTIGSKVAGIFDDPLIDPVLRSNKLDEKLRQMLFDHIVFTLDTIRDLLEETYGRVIDSWELQSLDESLALDKPQDTALEIMRRAGDINCCTDSQGEMNLNLLGLICKASGLETIAIALEIESELGLKTFNPDSLKNLIVRSVMLKKRLLPPSHDEQTKADENSNILKLRDFRNEMKQVK